MIVKFDLGIVRSWWSKGERENVRDTKLVLEEDWRWLEFGSRVVDWVVRVLISSSTIDSLSSHFQSLSIVHISVVMVRPYICFFLLFKDNRERRTDVWIRSDNLSSNRSWRETPWNGSNQMKPPFLLCLQSIDHLSLFAFVFFLSGRRFGHGTIIHTHCLSLLKEETLKRETGREEKPENVQIGKRLAFLCFRPRSCNKAWTRKQERQRQSEKKAKDNQWKDYKG